MRFYSIQKSECWELAKKVGYLEGSQEYSMFPKEYIWIIGQMKKRLNDYNGEYPVWLWPARPDLRCSGYVTKGEKAVLLEINIPEEKVLFSDFQAWHVVLNDCALDAFEGEPITKEESWERIFDLDFLRNHQDWRSIDLQATTGRVLLENIKLIKEFIGK